MYTCLENYSERAHQKGAPLKLSPSPDLSIRAFYIPTRITHGLISANACQGLSKSHHKFN